MLRYAAGRSPWIAAALLLAVAAAAPLAAQVAAPAVKAGVEKWKAGDYPGAVAAWQPPAAAGDADALFNMGQAYKLGRGVARDPAQARELYRRAAIKGHLPAQANLGILLFQAGEKAESMRWLKSAADKGEARAQYVFGIASFNGDGVARNLGLAYGYLLRASAQGLSQASNALTNIEGGLSPADHAIGEAVAASLAAGQGVPPALTNRAALPTARDDALHAPPAPPAAQVAAASQPRPAVRIAASPPPAARIVAPQGQADQAVIPQAAARPALPQSQAIIAAPRADPTAGRGAGVAVPPVATRIEPAAAAPPPIVPAASGSVRPAVPPPAATVAAVQGPPAPNEQRTTASSPPAGVPATASAAPARGDPAAPAVAARPPTASMPAPARALPPAAAVVRPRPAVAVATPEDRSDRPVRISEQPAKGAARARAAAPVWRVQLGAFGRKAQAEAAFAAFAAKHKSAIGSAKPVFDSDGGMTRLQLGPYPDQAAARAACARIAFAGQSCFTVSN